MSDTALAFLAPRIQTARLAGSHSPELTLGRMVRSGIPMDWTEQEQRFGLSD